MNLDKRKIAGELGIPEDVYNRIAKNFVNRTDELIKALDEGKAANDFDAIAKSAHAMKGAAGNLRLNDIFQIAQTIVTSSRDSKDEKAVEEGIAKLKVVFEELKKQF